MPGAPASASRPLKVEREPGRVRFVLEGPLDDASVAACWNEAMVAARAAEGGLSVDCTRVGYCGGAGFALLVALEEEAKQRKLTWDLQGLSPQSRAMFEGVDLGQLETTAVPDTRGGRGPVERVGALAAARGAEWRDQAAYLGEISAGVVSLAARPRRLRLREWWVIVEKAGTNALPIVALISFLMGMVMAFQAAMPMRQFGIDIFVVNLVALAMARELGPIMTAIVLAGRSGSAFAAEIGTMKVNEEVAALTTMGLDPVRFLAVPRVLAGIAVTPVLTVYAIVVGVAGGLSVMLLLGFPLSALTNQLSGAIKPNDLLAGLIKSFFFGAVVAGVGCMRGLQTGAGASAVGDSTTRSVVTSILLIVLLDALFAVIYYQLKF
jgi:phospholipid/cholesterol/gamma-HCH transport system permease protein